VATTSRRPAPEPFPGAATAVNLWEGGAARVARDLAAGFLPPAARAAALRPALDLAPAAFDYAAALAAAVARLYGAHAARGAPAAAAASVLHLGCAAGAGTFELARAFRAVLGVDARDDAVRAARLLQHHGQLDFARTTEGVLAAPSVARVGGADAAARARAAFAVGDAAALPADVAAAGPFDCVVVDALLTRLRQPLDLLGALAALVKPGGLLVISSNNDWTPAATPRNSWVGGFKMNGEACPTLHMLKYALKRAFALRETADVVRATAAHDRRMVVDVMEVSAWARE